MKKILIIRFSSIGDIVLTTPVMRCIKKVHTECEVHFVTKLAFRAILDSNPNIDKVYSFKDHISEIIDALKIENYDYIIDLHHNLRSALIKSKLKVPSKSFNKLNIEKWLIVNLKLNILPATHIVNRYLSCVPYDDVKYDGQGLDYYIPDADNVKFETLPDIWKNGFYSIAIGANHSTKRMPESILSKIIQETALPVILLGGTDDAVTAENLKNKNPGLVYNACGLYNLNQSASILKQSRFVITHDTGLMHIASAFRKRIISVWGNTIPSFGMHPFLPEDEGESVIVENNKLGCRPCSKIGYQKCPRHHFRCMNDINTSSVIEKAKEWW